MATLKNQITTQAANSKFVPTSSFPQGTPAFAAGPKETAAILAARGAARAKFQQDFMNASPNQQLYMANAAISSPTVGPYDPQAANFTAPQYAQRLREQFTAPESPPVAQVDPVQQNMGWILRNVIPNIHFRSESPYRRPQNTQLQGQQQNIGRQGSPQMPSITQIQSAFPAVTSALSEYPNYSPQALGQLIGSLYNPGPK